MKKIVLQQIIMLLLFITPASMIASQADDDHPDFHFVDKSFPFTDTDFTQSPVPFGGKKRNIWYANEDVELVLCDECNLLNKGIIAAPDGNPIIKICKGMIDSYKAQSNNAALKYILSEVLDEGYRVFRADHFPMEKGKPVITDEEKKRLVYPAYELMKGVIPEFTISQDVKLHGSHPYIRVDYQGKYEKVKMTRYIVPNKPEQDKPHLTCCIQ